VTLDSEVFWVTVGMALATYAMRAGGFAAMGLVPMSPGIERWLASVPGCVIVALTVPGLVEIGWLALPAALVTLGTMRALGNEFLALASGMAVLAATRAFLV